LIRTRKGEAVSDGKSRGLNKVVNDYDGLEWMDSLTICFGMLGVLTPGKLQVKNGGRWLQLLIGNEVKAGLLVDGLLYTSGAVKTRRRRLMSPSAGVTLRAATVIKLLEP
jgi:hypothetical protein